MVFQDAGDSLNPRLTAFHAIADPLRRLRKLGGRRLRPASSSSPT
jgi:peptide/nickel transport system ATP-binding protein